MEHLFNSVLLVDNMPDVLAVTQLFLQMSGFEVHTAHHAKEGIELYKALQQAHRTPQVFIADGALGDGDDGFTLLSKIKELDKQRLTTTFIYTAYGVERAKLLAIGSGAEAVIDKMKVGDKLIEEINAGLRNRQRRQARTMKAPGQMGGSWFTNREMAVYAINLIILITVVWFVSRMDAQLSFLTRKVEINEQNIMAEAGTRSMSFNALDGSIKEVKGAVGQISKGK